MLTNFQADGYSKVARLSGGSYELRVTINSGSGTVNLLRAPYNKTPDPEIDNYSAYGGDATGITASGGVLLNCGECNVVIQLASGSSPDIDVEINSQGGSGVNLSDVTPE